MPALLRAVLSTPRIHLPCHRLAALAGVALLGCAMGGPEHPLVGVWELNLDRTRYGSSADPRVQETFVCQPAPDAVRCTIRSVRADGQRISGGFTAPDDGSPSRVHGIPEMDQVRLWRTGDRSAEATFELAGKAVFGYRAIRSEDGTSLTILAVDPVSRARLESVAVYDHVR